MNQTILAIFLSFAVCTSWRAAAASDSSDCEQLKAIRMAMNATASNIVNVNTTRIPEGGPYRSKKVDCVAGKCEIQLELKTKSVYEPDHPDADEYGYVSYPDIDVRSQENEMSRLIGEYEQSVRACYSPST